jgi:hypothetical protein
VRLREWNPFLDAGAARHVLGLTVDLALRVVRIGHTRRCQSETRELLSCLRTLAGMSAEASAGDPTVLQELVLKSNLCATNLSTKRTYMLDPRDTERLAKTHAGGKVGYQDVAAEGGAGEGGAMLFDPRFLVFEFIHNIMSPPTHTLPLHVLSIVVMESIFLFHSNLTPAPCPAGCATSRCSWCRSSCRRSRTPRVARRASSSSWAPARRPWCARCSPSCSPTATASSHRLPRLTSLAPPAPL